MKRLITTAMLAMMMCVCSQAALVTFDLTNPGTTLNSPLSFSGSGSELGVDFVSSLELSALAGANLLVDANGTGVAGSGASFEINAGEGIDFAAPTITSRLGGDAIFTGFHSITFSEFHNGDTGTVGQTGASTPLLTVSSNGETFLSSIGNPTALTLRGTGDAAPSDNGFQVTQVVASFTVIPTASAVPEPTSFAALLLIGGCAVTRRRRRNAKK